jgi:hypothetical protein
MKLLPLICTIVFISCWQSKQKPAKKLTGNTTATAQIAATINYDSCKKQIVVIKQQYKKGWQQLPVKNKQQIFTNAIVKTIVPSWIGTDWDFNGTSETPQKGAIACGYFVTTVLRDAGLPLARVKLAQCASEQMITTLVQPKYVKRFSNIALPIFVHEVKQMGYGIYIVGLDNHTGFIYNDGNDVYFIHSTFVGTRNVQKELAAASTVLQQSRYKVLAKLSADEKVLNKWIE